MCESRKSIQIDREEQGWGREIGSYAAPTPPGSLDHGYSPLCSLRCFDISALARSLILAVWQIFSRLLRAVSGGMKGCYGTVVRKRGGVEGWTRGALMMRCPPSPAHPVCTCVWAPRLCSVPHAEAAANRSLFPGSLIRPNPGLPLTPTVSFVMYWSIDPLIRRYTNDNKHTEK